MIYDIVQNVWLQNIRKSVSNETLMRAFELVIFTSSEICPNFCKISLIITKYFNIWCRDISYVIEDNNSSWHINSYYSYIYFLILPPWPFCAIIFRLKLLDLNCFFLQSMRVGHQWCYSIRQWRWLLRKKTIPEYIWSFNYIFVWFMSNKLLNYRL